MLRPGNAKSRRSRSEKDLEDKIDHYLAHPAERETITQAARVRAPLRDHTPMPTGCAMLEHTTPIGSNRFAIGSNVLRDARWKQRRSSLLSSSAFRALSCAARSRTSTR